jgi:protein required for attachment to host cells
MTTTIRRNWLVVANAARARVLEEADRPGAYVHVADLVHPQSRQRGTEIEAGRGGDRPGHAERSGHGRGSASYLPRADPRAREHDRFAREVAAVLDDGVAAGRCAGLVLVASDPFRGQLKAHLGREATKALLRTVAHDYTMLTDDELARRLAAASAR